jgi:sulfur-oxidizing protein SoxY
MPHSHVPSDRPLPSRRIVLAQAAGAAVLLSLRSAFAETADMEKAIRDFTGGARVTPGRIKIEVAPLVENGNSVALGLDVESPMTAENHVTTIALFNEKNPQPQVARFHLGPHAGTAHVETRIRLATTQRLHAIARMSDGSLWSDDVEVIVTIAACTEE